jgi:hypothetical protein
MGMIAQETIGVWLALEIGLLIRDRIRGKGGLARDKGTIWLNFLFMAVAVSVAGGLTGPRRTRQFPGWCTRRLFLS